MADPDEDFADEEPVPEPVVAPEPVAVLDPVEAPEHVQTITVDVFARAQSVYPAPVVKAFVTVEKSNFKIRKLSADEWQQLFSAFLTVERR